MGLCHISFLPGRSEELRKANNSRSALSKLQDWPIFLKSCQGTASPARSYCCSASQSRWEQRNSVIDTPLVGYVIAIRKTLPQLWRVLTSTHQVNFLNPFWTHSFKSHLVSHSSRLKAVGVWSYCWNTCPSALHTCKEHSWIWFLWHPHSYSVPQCR